MAPAVMSQTAARRRALAMRLEAGLLRLRGFFFLGIGDAKMLPRTHFKRGSVFRRRNDYILAHAHRH